MNRRDGHLLRATLIWVALSALGIIVVLLLSPNMVDWGILPPIAADRTDEVNQVLRRLFTLLSVPVFFLVVVYAGYSVFAFRSRGRPSDDGPAVRGNLPLQMGWLVVSFVLVAFLFGYGLYFLNRASAAPQGNVLQVTVTGEQWLWDYAYPQYNISGTTLELPVGRPVEFTIHSIDVQHSFWIPSFALKQDAVPGNVTYASATPNKIGEYVVRCAELCGIYHAYMNTPVKVVSASDFDAWVASQQSAQPASASRLGGFPVVATGDMVVRRSSVWLEG